MTAIQAVNPQGQNVTTIDIGFMPEAQAKALKKFVAEDEYSIAGWEVITSPSPSGHQVMITRQTIEGAYEIQHIVNEWAEYVTHNFAEILSMAS